MAKNVYDYTVRLDKDGNSRFFNEAGEVDKPENSISYLLVGLINCTALTLKPILEKMRIECDAISVNGKLYMVDDKVRYSDRIDCTIKLENAAELTEEQKARLAELTKKHCSVSVTIQKNPTMTLRLE